MQFWSMDGFKKKKSARVRPFATEITLHSSPDTTVYHLPHGRVVPGSALVGAGTGDVMDVPGSGGPVLLESK